MDCLSREAKCIALEKEHVHEVYEKTAHHFNGVHYKAWPKVQEFLQDLEPGAFVADVGCGNGRYLHINPNIFTLGSDRSHRLAGIAREHCHTSEVMVCDNLRLPYRDHCFDGIISIAVIHHFTTARRRARAIRELARVLRPGGRIMIYVWAMEQKKRQFRCQDVLVPWHLKPKHDVHNEKAKRSSQGHHEVNGFDDDISHTEKTCSLTASMPNNVPAISHKTAASTSRSGTSTRQDLLRRMHESNHSRSLDSQKGTSIKRGLKFPWHSLSTKEVTFKSSPNLSTPQVSTVKPIACIEARCTRPQSASEVPDSAKELVKSKPVLQREKSLPIMLKDHVLNLFSSKAESKLKESAVKNWPKDKLAISQVKDNQYKALMEQIIREDTEIMKLHRPLLEHSLSASEVEVFAVREFPCSSRPDLRKHRSMDVKGTKVNNIHTDHNCSYKTVMETENDQYSTNLDSQRYTAFQKNLCAKLENNPQKVTVSRESAEIMPVEDLQNSHCSMVSSHKAVLTEHSLKVLTEHSLKVANDDALTAESHKQSHHHGQDVSPKWNLGSADDVFADEVGGTCLVNGHCVSKEGSRSQKATCHYSDPIPQQTKSTSSTPKKSRRKSSGSSLGSGEEEDWAEATVKAIHAMQTQVDMLARSCYMNNGDSPRRYSNSSLDIKPKKWTGPLLREDDLYLEEMEKQVMLRRSKLGDSPSASGISSDTFSESASDIEDIPHLSKDDFFNIVEDPTSSPDSLVDSVFENVPESNRTLTDSLHHKKCAFLRFKALKRQNAGTEMDMESENEQSGSVMVGPSRKSSSSTSSTHSVSHYSGSTHSTSSRSASNGSVSSTENDAGNKSEGDQYMANTCKRFYHVFREGELVDLIEKYVTGLHVLESFYDHANWCVIAEKVDVWKI